MQAPSLPCLRISQEGFLPFEFDLLRMFSIFQHLAHQGCDMLHSCAGQQAQASQSNRDLVLPPCFPSLSRDWSIWAAWLLQVPAGMLEQNPTVYPGFQESFPTFSFSSMLLGSTFLLLPPGDLQPKHWQGSPWIMSIPLQSQGKLSLPTCRDVPLSGAGSLLLSAA